MKKLIPALKSALWFVVFAAALYIVTVIWK